MKNLPNLFSHCQTGYFAVAIDTCFELLVPPGGANQVPEWHMIGSTREHGPFYCKYIYSQQVSAPRIGMLRLTDLDRALAIGQLQADRKSVV